MLRYSTVRAEAFQFPKGLRRRIDKASKDFMVNEKK
jgi:hypothetical protein